MTVFSRPAFLVAAPAAAAVLLALTGLPARGAELAAPMAHAASASASTAAASPASAPAVMASAAASAAAIDPAKARAACAALQGSLADSAAGLKLEGAMVDSATLVQSGGGSSCKVTGSATLAAGGAAIRFQASLPSEWNRRAVQFADGLEAPHLMVDPQAAVAAGYLVYGLVGTGSAAQGGSASAGDERVVAQLKLYDVAQELMARRYERLSYRVFLVAAQEEALLPALVKSRPYAFRGVLADAVTGARAGGAAAASKAASAPAASTPADAMTPDLVLAAASLQSFSANGTKLIVLAPAGFEATLGGFFFPAAAPAASAASDAAGVAPAAAAVTEPLVLRAYRVVLGRIGLRVGADALQHYMAPAGETRALEKVDWLQVLTDWTENSKAPSAIEQLPPRR